MTETEKLAAYDRIVEIIDRQTALEGHMRRDGSAVAKNIGYRREDAYKDIAEEVKGVEFRLRL